MLSFYRANKMTMMTTMIS